MIKEWLLRRKAEKQIKMEEKAQKRVDKEFKNTLFDRLVRCSKNGVNIKFMYYNINRFDIEVKLTPIDKQYKNIERKEVNNPYSGVKMIIEKREYEERIRG